MTPERWQRVKEIFDAAVSLAPGERAAFVGRACAGDAELRREVEALVASHAAAGSFMESPAVGEVAVMLDGEGRGLEVGQSVGHYRIVGLLGAGGMGEVYLAEDTGLKRKVAIKLLPPDASADGTANRRLLREARAAATLDHPHICSVYEVGEDAGRTFVVMQYVEGETLDARMRRQPLSLEEAVALAAQIADALTEAHAQGVVHRDIKPSNVLLNRRGRALVTDFGLAKLTREGALTGSGARTQSLLTTPGMVVGTVPYMSPEQVRGEEVDARTDLFSLGVLLYEMLSGRQPFAAESVADTMSAILTYEPPPLARYSREANAELERIVAKALRKDREERYQTARDLLLDLRSLADEMRFEARLERSTPPDTKGGPRGWSNQNFPEGKAEHPVTDVTWYEAAAYAAFRGKQLPSIFQWEKAARDGNVLAAGNHMPWGLFYPGDTLDHRANFDNDGTRPVSSAEFGMSPFGAYNMAGNVSEWTFNDSSQGHIATGGAWGDRSYTFAQYAAFPGFYSSEKLGFRCALNSPGATGDQGATRIEIKQEIPVYAVSSDADFERWSAAYRYDRTPLDPQIVEVTETPEWRREKITFNGADNERAIAYLYLPKNFPRPLQVIHIAPAGDVESGRRSLSASMEDRLGPVIKSGRAAFGVVIKGYIERLRPEGYVEPDETTIEYREKIVNRITDVRRGLDYLETRGDIDPRRIAFYGPSAGSAIGLILAAVDERYASVFLMGAGVVKSDLQTIAEANPINFAPHVRAPKLMMHGRYDEDTALKTSAEPLFKLLREPKRMTVYEGTHIPSIELLATTINGWLDETLGPVRRE